MASKTAHTANLRDRRVRNLPEERRGRGAGRDKGGSGKTRGASEALTNFSAHSWRGPALATPAWGTAWPVVAAATSGARHSGEEPASFTLVDGEAPPRLPLTGVHLRGGEGASQEPSAAAGSPFFPALPFLPLPSLPFPPPPPFGSPPPPPPRFAADASKLCCFKS